VQVDGDPPGAVFVAPGEPAQRPRDAFVVPGALGLPSLVFVNLRRGHACVELWEIDEAQRFVRPRPAAFELGRGDPGDVAVVEALALPRLQALVVVRQERPRPQASLHRLDMATGRLLRIAEVEPDPFAHAPAPWLGVLQLAPDTVLVLHRTGRVPLGRWGDVARENHLVLYSPREPLGLPLLTLALDDGNVSHWGLDGSRLWLHSVDGRLRPQPKIFDWSIDLAAAL